MSCQYKIRDLIKSYVDVHIQSTVNKITFFYGLLFGYGYFLAGIYWIAISLLVDVEKFAWSVRNEKREGKPYYINLQNPRYYDGFWHGYLSDADSFKREGLMNRLVSEGYDGIIIDTDTWNDTGDEYAVTSKQYVVFNPENIKPA